MAGVDVVLDQRAASKASSHNNQRLTFENILNAQHRYSDAVPATRLDREVRFPSDLDTLSAPGQERVAPGVRGQLSKGTRGRRLSDQVAGHVRRDWQRPELSSKRTFAGRVPLPAGPESQ